MRIIDISQPSNLIEVGYNDGLRAECIDVSGDYAFAGEPNAGLHVLDVSNPAAPTRVGFVAYTGDTQKLKIQGDYAYATINYVNTSLKIIDVSDPANPVLTGTYERPESFAYFHGLSLAGNYAYVGGMLGVAGMWVIDVSNPALPVLAAHRSVGECRDVTLQGSRAYATRTSGLVVFDISTLANPIQIGMGTYAEGDEVVVDGDDSFVSGFFRGLQVMDLSNESSPTTPSPLSNQRTLPARSLRRSTSPAHTRTWPTPAPASASWTSRTH